MLKIKAQTLPSWVSGGPIDGIVIIEPLWCWFLLPSPLIPNMSLLGLSGVKGPTFFKFHFVLINTLTKAGMFSLLEMNDIVGSKVQRPSPWANKCANPQGFVPCLWGRIALPSHSSWLLIELLSFFSPYPSFRDPLIWVKILLTSRHHL
jgi:hypothetical protein